MNHDVTLYNFFCLQKVFSDGNVDREITDGFVSSADHRKAQQPKQVHIALGGTT